jgi:hypothetical protein
MRSGLAVGPVCLTVCLPTRRQAVRRSAGILNSSKAKLEASFAPDKKVGWQIGSNYPIVRVE